MTEIAPLEAGARVLVLGYGLHGQAVAQALVARSIDVCVVDDAPSDEALIHATGLDLMVVVAPDAVRLDELVRDASHLLPTPGLPDHHPVFAAAHRAGLPTLGEFDLARQWDQRPIVAITGTNGKTTVTTMVTDMLCRSGVAAVAAGNLEVPLVAAIDDPSIELFVVEASSFRLGHAAAFTPRVATWLNFDPDHLDVHASLAAYEAAKARIWAHLPDDGVAIANVDDAVVMRNLPGHGRRMTFGAAGGDARVVASAEGEQLWVDGEALLPVAELTRRLPHDVANALAAAATAIAAGAHRDAVAETLRTFRGLPHRVELVGDADGVQWYDDSKATTPHAVVAGVAGFASVVLVAGGRNKGVDLSTLGALAERLRAVVAIGDAADEVEAVFAGRVPVARATSMQQAVQLAAELATSGDAVVLSPGCTSYDWYSNYGERGDDFSRIVRELIGGPVR